MAWPLVEELYFFAASLSREPQCVPPDILGWNVAPLQVGEDSGGSGTWSCILLHIIIKYNTIQTVARIIFFIAGSGIWDPLSEQTGSESDHYLT